MSLEIRIIAGLVGFIFAVSMTVLWGEHRHSKGVEEAQAQCTAAIDAQKIKAAGTLAEETARANQLTEDLATAHSKQELTDAFHKKTVSDLGDRLRRAGGSTGRLRDPNAETGCRSGSSSATGQTAAGTDSGADDGAKAGGLFSAGATELLTRLTTEADEVNAAYASCRADAYLVRSPPGFTLGDARLPPAE